MYLLIGVSIQNYVAIFMNKYELAKKINELEGLTNDEKSELIKLLRSQKKYGLVWEDKPEDAEQRMVNEQPVLVEVPERAILSDDAEAPNHILIEGDNLEALTALSYTHTGKIDVIYIDPPYNTGNKDFVYNDSFVDKENGYRHSMWLSFMNKRLKIAKNLLSEKGVIFISCDDNEQAPLKMLCDEIFSEANFFTNLIWQSTPGSNTGKTIKTVTEYVLMYAKQKVLVDINSKPVEDTKKYKFSDEYLEHRGPYIPNKLDRRMTGSHYSEALNYPIQTPDGTMLYPGCSTEKQEHWNWRWSKSKVEWGLKNDFILIKNNAVYFKQYEKVDNEDKPIKRSLPYQNLLNIDGANSAAGTREVMNLLGSKYFDYPKPLNLLLYLLKMANLKDGDIILDFFSGSATTAHAVMLMNTIEKDACKYILIQLPEKTDMKSEAYKNGYINICEIGKERIRRAGAKIKEENPIGTQDLDIGFRVLKLDDSNMNDVYYGVKDYDQGMLSMLESNIKEGRTDLDLLFGCLLEWGLPLSLPHTTENINGFTIHNYNDGDLIACFDEDISDDIIKEIAKKQPLRVVFRDSSFPNSPSKINVSEIFKMLAPRTSVKVI